MLIRIVGRGALAEPIAGLAERAGHTVRWAERAPAAPSIDESFDLAILVGSRSSVEADLADAAAERLHDLVVVDAIVPTRDTLDDSSPETVWSIEAESAWIATMFPEARIVRAFASVPAQAFTDLLNRNASDAPRLAVPFAGDDRDAKARVGKFMRELGVEPYDLGALDSADVLDPGGPLWGKALSQLELLEAVGRLSGDG